MNFEEIKQRHIDFETNHKDVEEMILWIETAKDLLLSAGKGDTIVIAIAEHLARLDR